MWEWALVGLAGITTVVLILQDFRYYEVSAAWLFLTGFIYAACSLVHVHYAVWLKFVAMNLAFLTGIMILLFLYFSVSRRRLQNIIDTYIGKADILFLAFSCLCFSTVNYLFFFNAGLLFSLIIYGGFSLSKNHRKKRQIPLVGTMGLTLIAFLIMTRLNGGSYYDDWILSWMY